MSAETDLCLNVGFRTLYPSRSLIIYPTFGIFPIDTFVFVLSMAGNIKWRDLMFVLWNNCLLSGIIPSTFTRSEGSASQARTILHLCNLTARQCLRPIREPSPLYSCRLFHSQIHYVKRDDPTIAVIGFKYGGF